MIQAVLTIDDMPSPNTPAIVNFLKEKNIMPVFFSVGQLIEKYYEEAVYALKNGMLIGNHSYSHPFFSKLTLQECIEEIEKTEEILEQLYKDAGVERKYKLFRFPYIDKGGVHKDNLQNYLREHGYCKINDTEITSGMYDTLGWKQDMDVCFTYDFEEYTMQLKEGVHFEDILEKMNHKNPVTDISLLEHNSKQIVLLHDHEETEKIMPAYYEKLVNYAINRGVHFVNAEFTKWLGE